LSRAGRKESSHAWCEFADVGSCAMVQEGNVFQNIQGNGPGKKLDLRLQSRKGRHFITYLLAFEFLPVPSIFIQN
jgi:hypothetical protein